MPPALDAGELTAMIRTRHKWHDFFIAMAARPERSIACNRDGAPGDLDAAIALRGSAAALRQKFPTDQQTLS